MENSSTHQEPSKNHLTNETILINSVICTKKIVLIAEKKINLKEDIEYKLHEGVSFSPNPSGITIKSFPFKDTAVIMGFIKGTLIINGTSTKKVVLPFQLETRCEGVSDRDTIKHTKPLIEGVVPPLLVPKDDLSESVIILKVLLETQITISREKIVKSVVEIIEDVEENRDRKQDSQMILPVEIFKDINNFEE